MSSSCASIKRYYQRFIMVEVLLVTIFCGLLIVGYYAELPNQFALPFIVFAFTCFSLFALLAHYLFHRAITRELHIFSQLESWADLSTIRGELQPLPAGQHSITNVIESLVEQLECERNRDNYFDTRLRSNALLDRQTGVGNREFFNNRLEALIKEDDVQGAVYFIHFKEGDLIHSLYGDQQAVVLFKSLVKSIRKRLNKLPDYYIARRSEFELAVIVPSIFVKEAEKLAEQFIRSLSVVPLPIGVNKDEFVHIGVSYFSQDENAYQIKSEADMALRSAQLHGPSQWFMYDPGEVEHQRAKGSLQWRTFLTQAIEKNSFVMFSQPVIGKDGEAVLHHEVLAKVRDTDGSLISARVFLPMADKCGLAVQVDILVIEHVCRLLAYDVGGQEKCSVNLSVDSLLSSDFVSRFMTILRKNTVEANRLIIEISEYQIVNHHDKLRPVLISLQQHGLSILSDNVGQYVQSTSYIKSCPINYMKLHRSIVLNIHLKPENQIVIQSIKAVVERHHIELYAVGIESTEEWQTLLRLGVNGGQGHYFNEPVAQVAKAIHLP